MKAVVLARGLGTRMQAADTGAPLSDSQARAADAGVKALMPIGGRPFISYLIESLSAAGIRRVGLVVAPETELRTPGVEPQHPASSLQHPVSLELIVQQEPRGTADAVLAAEHWVAGDPFVVVNGDNLYPRAALAAVVGLDGPGLAVFSIEDMVASGAVTRERVRAFAVVELDADARLVRIVEKPDERAEMAAVARGGVSMNCWRFDARIFAACRDVTPSPRGELELPAAVTLACSRGVSFQAIVATGAVLDISRRSDIATVERLLTTMPGVWS